MRRLWAFLLCAVLMMSSGGCLFVYNSEVRTVTATTQPLPKEKIVFKTTSPPGLEFSGTLKVDGETREIHATSPWELPLECATLSGRLKKVKGDGELGFEIDHDAGPGFNQMQCSFSASPGCRFEYTSDGGLTVTSALTVR